MANSETDNYLIDIHPPTNDKYSPKALILKLILYVCTEFKKHSLSLCLKMTAYNWLFFNEVREMNGINISQLHKLIQFSYLHYQEIENTVTRLHSYIVNTVFNAIKDSLFLFRCKF
ncbi:uncharacterized protein LOC128249669 [Octopus bimaculoides]|uniref:uncharacterized protein LOC128249669 n=1 Tax=Octopus bimaculoides TaxID=37653 RepID=UPI0022E5362E|nr:uncharacterized protein LOC128249669 [Octopus bimaculoides]